MAAFGIPAEVLTGVLVGGAVGSAIVFELPADSPLAKTMMKNKTRRMISSTVIGIALGIMTDPLTTIVAELPIFFSMCIKSKAVTRSIKNLEKGMKNNDTKYFEFDGHIHKMSKIHNRIFIK